MRVINADGSEAEMCGNGIRCVVRYLIEQTESDGEPAPDTVRIETLAGIIEARVLARQPEFIVRASIGTPMFEPRDIPVDNAAFVSMGNPHVVIFEKLQGDAEAQLRSIDLVSVAGPCQQPGLFPNGTNVHLAIATGGDHLDVRHWERGVGFEQFISAR